MAQLVRALDCGSRGRRFEPDYLPKWQINIIGLPFSFVHIFHVLIHIEFVNLKI